MAVVNRTKNGGGSAEERMTLDKAKALFKHVDLDHFSDNPGMECSKLNGTNTQPVTVRWGEDMLELLTIVIEGEAVLEWKSKPGMLELVLKSVSGKSVRNENGPLLSIELCERTGMAIVTIGERDLFIHRNDIRAMPLKVTDGKSGTVVLSLANTENDIVMYDAKIPKGYEATAVTVANPKVAREAVLAFMRGESAPAQ